MNILLSLKKFHNGFCMESKVIKGKVKIEVYVTDIHNVIQSEFIRREILVFYPELKIDFDLEDVDRVLRVEGIFNSVEIKDRIRSKGYKCEEMK